MRRRGPVSGISSSASATTATRRWRQKFLPGMINGTERWCQGFSEPGAGSDLASLTTTAVRDGDDYVIHGHKIWTSYSDVADWCLLLARTDKNVPKHKGISAFIVPMHQDGIEQRPLKMISGVTKEFGQVEFDGARVSADHMVGAPGDGWKLAMTVVSHEREPSTLGFSARYGKLVRQLASRARRPGSGGTVVGVGADRDVAAARATAAVRAAGRHDARSAGIARQAADDVGRAVRRPRRPRYRRHGRPQLFERLPVQPRPERDGRHVADPEEHHRSADIWDWGPEMYGHAREIDVTADGGAADHHPQPARRAQRRQRCACTSGWPRSGPRSTRMPTRTQR